LPRLRYCLHVAARGICAPHRVAVGRIYAELCHRTRTWNIPGSTRTSIGKSTINDWIARYRRSGGELDSLLSRFKNLLHYSSAMSASEFKLPRPPIVEAIVDIDCDPATGLRFEDLEGPARERLRDKYPEFQTKLIHELEIRTKPTEPPNPSFRRGIQAFQFLQRDKKQLVQIRIQGFSFNRLAPYTTLDEYLPEIERTWAIYRELASPVQVKLVRLRYINRIMLPRKEGRMNLDDYFTVAPRLPDEEKLRMIGFLHQHTAEEVETGHHVSIILTAQPPEGNSLPVILDNTVTALNAGDPAEWPWILSQISALRASKNEIFRKTVTDECLNLFQRP